LASAGLSNPQFQQGMGMSRLPRSFGNRRKAPVTELTQLTRLTQLTN
jgi:hypothetical protein